MGGLSGKLKQLSLGKVLTVMKGTTMRAFFLAMALFWLQFAARADGLRVESFDGAGRLTFNEIPTATVYRVESASALGGSWTAASNGSVAITAVATGSGSVTCSVPMAVARQFYRVVATVTNAVSPGAPSGQVLIPSGISTGTDPDAGAYSLTNDAAFYMDTHEVTKALWDAVKNWNGGNGYSYNNSGSGKGTNHPVQGVNWYDCVKWCNARSDRDGLTPVYYTDVSCTQVYKSGQVNALYVMSAATGYRLPTDVEWQYAARGGVSGRRFPWGDTNTIQHTRANYQSIDTFAYDTSETRNYHPTYTTGNQPYTSPVGAFAPNGYGLYDVAGNVSEWCFDWFPIYENQYRIVRGGSWAFTANACRVAERRLSSPNSVSFSNGFRTVRKPLLAD
jgi:formylglycine-generating enzyme required for sulfatase activity